MQPTLRNGDSRERERDIATAPPAGSERKGSGQPLSAPDRGLEMSPSVMRRRPNTMQREGLRAQELETSEGLLVK